jgi:aryl-alcohol dehydrogenase-like predicted oxidoreductase
MSVQLDVERLTLGATDIEISPMGFGTWAWGDRWVWGYGGSSYSDEDLREAYQVTIAAGINFFDTAEVYGLGRSETLLGRFAREDSQPIVVATKFVPYPWRLSRTSVRRALAASLERLGLDKVDLYQIHVPLPPVPTKVWMHAMADAIGDGMTRAVGVSNYSFQQMGEAHNVLQERGVVLASNQVHYSLLHRDPETNGVLQLCRDLNITLLAYSPLEMGILTGKYTPDNPPSGSRRYQYSPNYLRRVQPVIERMHTIGDTHGGKSPAQVAINWTLCKGTVPIPGAKNARQALSNAQALGWRLTEDEVLELEELAARV